MGVEYTIQANHTDSRVTLEHFDSRRVTLVLSSCILLLFSRQRVLISLTHSLSLSHSPSLSLPRILTEHTGPYAKCFEM